MLALKDAILFKIVHTCAMTPKDFILFKTVHTCAKECLILKYKYVQNPWYYVLWDLPSRSEESGCVSTLIHLSLYQVSLQVLAFWQYGSTSFMSQVKISVLFWWLRYMVNTHNSHWKLVVYFLTLILHFILWSLLNATSWVAYYATYNELPHLALCFILTWFRGYYIPSPFS